MNISSGESFDYNYTFDIKVFSRRIEGPFF